MAHLQPERQPMIDRPLQKKLLEKMKSQYPNKMSTTIGDLNTESTYKKIKFNLIYLQEHGLIENASASADIATMNDGSNGSENAYPVKGKITCKGIDFLENDGGLSAILNVVTVKLHSETLSALEAKILVSEDIPTEDKPRLLDRLRSLPEEGAKTLIQEMVKTGLSRGPEVWETALRFLSS